MTTERLAVEQAAEAIVQVARAEKELLVGGDPLALLAPHVDNLDHMALCKVSVVLLQRFADTVRNKLAGLEALAATSSQKVVPALQKLMSCISAHHAFQSSYSVTPLLHRVITLAAQCCGLALRDLSDPGAVLPVTNYFSELAEVISEAIADRVNHFRPLDSIRISRVHQAFQAYEAELRATLAGSIMEDRSLRELAPPAAPITHSWRNEELRQFWDARCAPKYEGPVPVDALALFLLSAAGADSTLSNRESMMKRLSRLNLKKPEAGVEAAELDSCRAEMRRCGGLRAWVNTLLESGGAEVAGPARTGTVQLASTSASFATSYRSTATPHASTWPGSARSMGSSFTPRKPFALSSSLGRSVATGSVDPLHSAAERNLLKTSQRLVFGEKAAVDVRSGAFAETPLHVAAMQDDQHAPLASLLLECGADANAEDKNLATPLHAACVAGHTRVARKLMACGANVCKEDRWNTTPLHRAAESGQTELVQLLLKGGAVASATDEWGSTPLHRASARGQLAVAEQLLASALQTKVADMVNAEDRRGDRPLHLAAARGDYAMVKLLLECGGTATARSRLAGKTPEDCARDRGHADVVTLIQHRNEWATPRQVGLAN